MNFRLKFLLMLVILSLFTLVSVSASDVNSTDLQQFDDSPNLEVTDISKEVTLQQNDSGQVIQEKPKISIKSNKVKSKDTLDIYLKDSKGNAIKSKKLKAEINNKSYSLYTNSKGIANLKINLPSSKYELKLSFKGDDKYKSVNKTFKIKVSKLVTKIDYFSNFVVRGKHLYFYLIDEHGEGVSNKKLNMKLVGNTHTKKTNSKGRAGVKINLYYSSYPIKVSFEGDDYYKSTSRNVKFFITSSTSLLIGNSKLLTKGFLRVYLKGATKSDISKKTIKIKLGGKQFSKKTNSEGIVIIKPRADVKTYRVIAKLGKYYVSKKIKCVEGKVKDPLEENITLKNGVPDIDVMPRDYVMADDSATYTLEKAQYLEVIKRDSKCLFLHNKLTKYTFFKTKSHPNVNHIIKREKWNVIERAINLKVVNTYKKVYWPGEITVSLKGKSYTYPEVRDVQNTGYTCGPASASVCSQVLRNYVSEKLLKSQAGTNKSYGTKCSGIKKALEKHNFNCTYFYADSFDHALDELKKGGCALVFHTKRHYVSILDISKDGKKVLVSNSYGSYYNIPTKWLSVSYMKTRFVEWDDSLIVRLNYSLSNATKKSLNSFYESMGPNWARHNTHENILK